MYLATEEVTRTFTFPAFLLSALNAVAFIVMMIWVKLALYRRNLAEDNEKARRLRKQREYEKPQHHHGFHVKTPMPLQTRSREVFAVTTSVSRRSRPSRVSHCLDRWENEGGRWIHHHPDAAMNL